MEKKGLNELRRLFREFYVSKEHYAAKSASLIPKDDKSLLIINSGMAPLKRYFAGLDTPPAKRMTTCQKCVRTGDIENVGKTSRHGTFFEMLGSFSFGDYFKKESIEWGWEFMTKVLELPVEKLWATVYLDDDQAEELWQNVGMPKERIVRLGKEDNFWEIGLGPCGPCSEIYFDRGEEYGCDNPDCKPGCDCDRYVEFWNHVFTQFSKEEDGSYSNLEHPNIDTGMGLERLACIIQGVTSIFDIDTIRYILDGVLELSGVEYEKEGTEATDVSVRIITDHLRSMVFMIADGITPSNEGRGYVLRRLIRRAVRHGKLIGIDGTFLSKLSEKVIQVSGEAYPELVEKRELIQRIIEIEEEKFASTLDQGMNMIQDSIKDMKNAGDTVMNGEVAFKLYDTYGFPMEMTEEILEENGFTLDKNGFDESMARQKKMAQDARKSDDDEGWKEAVTALDLPETIFTGYEMLSGKSKVLAVQGPGGKDRLSEGDKGIIYFDETPFYAESGGQIYDIGFIGNNDGLEVVVNKVTKSNGLFAHEVDVKKGNISTGEEVQLFVDVKRRHLIMRNHTATHLLQKALRDVLGTHVEQAGSLVNDETLRFDFTHFQGMTDEELKAVENLVNEKIYEFLPVTVIETTMDEAVKMGAMALFGEKYGNEVRVVKAGDFSTELCGGTHVNNTGEIGSFKILSESGIASGVRRIEAVTASGVLNLFNEDEKILFSVAKSMKSTKDQLVPKAESLVEEVKSLNKELSGYKKAEMGDAAEEMIASAKEINGVKLITKEFKDADVDDLRNLSDDIKNSASNIAMVLASVNEGKVVLLVSLSDDLVEKGHHAGKMIKEIAAACGGGGGGKANMAQAGGKDPSKISDAFQVAENLIAVV